jgi:hypothetical protein
LIPAKLEVCDQLEAIVLGGHTVVVQRRLTRRARNADRTTGGRCRCGPLRCRGAGLRPGFAEPLRAAEALHAKVDQRVGVSL